MTVMRGFLISIGSGFVGALIGACIGVALAANAPAYYRTVFDRPELSQGDALQLGIGLGITQGLTLGVVVGLVVVLATAWLEAKRIAHSPDSDRW